MKDIKIAIDLGTTTIDMCLLNDLGELLSSKSIKNRQSLYGSDVINRILTATRDDKYIKIMKTMVLDDISESISAMLKECNIPVSCVGACCICGNTTMISILMEYSLEKMGVYPFETLLNKSISLKFKDLFEQRLDIDCSVILSGCVSAFIGGDIIAGIIYINDNYKAFDKTDISLLIDLGTNGEMVINNKGRLIATSTACGPAFEGSVKKQGVYGSTLIDAIVLGLKTKKISADGIISDEYIDKGINISGVHINADILREILSAKAAIRTGIDYLIQECNITCEDIDNVFIAGGFGQYLNIDNSVYIGMLPEKLSSKLKVCGNTSLKGASLIVCDRTYVDVMDSYTKENINVIQLADKSNYQESLINNMCFKRS